MTELPSSDTRHGRCINDGHCSLADARTPIAIGLLVSPDCPECGKPLVVIPPVTKKTIAIPLEFKLPKKLIIAGLALLGLISVAVFMVISDPLKDAALGETTKENQPDASDLSFRVVTNLLTLGASPETHDKLAPALAAAFLEPRGCGGITQRLTRTGRLLLICDVGDQRFTITITNAKPAAGFTAPGQLPIDALLTATPRAGTDVRDASVIGFDTVAVIVSKANRLDCLTVAEAAAIFAGKTGDFTAVGGTPGAIAALAAGNSSAEVQAFSALALGGQPLAASVRRLADANDTAVTVAGDSRAIGIVTPDRIGAAKALAIGADAQSALLPLPDAIATGRYPLSRPIAVEVPHDSRQAQARQFAAFANTRAGQKAVRLAGFAPRWPKLAANDLTALPPGYPPMLEGATRLPLVLQFEPGSNALTPESATGLARAAADLARRGIPPERLVVLGFADPSPDAKGLSLRLAERVAAGLADAGVTAGNVRGLGDVAPLADNTTDAGRNQNRRAEIWIRP